MLDCCDGGEIEVYEDGKQTCSFLYVEECIECLRCLMESESFNGPVNIGSEEMISINDLAEMIIGLSSKNIKIYKIQ